MLRRGALLVMALASAAGPAVAQGAVGAGPLTSSLAETEPETGVIRVGALRIAPGLTIREAGHDDNVFDEAVDQKEDWVIAATPDIAVFTRTQFAQISAYAGSDMQWYKTYTSENDIGYMGHARVDLLLSRIMPFIGGGTTRRRTRPNGEIDVRADEKTDELSGGLAYSLFAYGKVFGSAIVTDTDYKDAFESGVSLEQSLSRRTIEYQGGVKTDLTPLLAMEVHGSYMKEEFRLEPMRNGDSRMGSAVFTFDPAAIISGTATIGYQDYRPVDPQVKGYRGVTGSGFITYPLMEIGRFNFGYNRGMEYSFDIAEAYYVENTVRAVYTQRLFGAIDAQVQAIGSQFNYGNREGAPDRKETLEIYNGNFGYNLPNRTRVAMNYEYARRGSPDIAERNYIRRRIFMSWIVAF
jgi:hypothetical protein